MEIRYITVKKSSRFYLLGKPGPAIKTVWFACHGYMQLARFFQEHFKVLEDEALGYTQSKRAQPRVPFGSLIERGMIKPGTTLMDAKRKHVAKVRSDGTLITEGTTGSIHQIGAHVQGAPACNGWTFWHVEQKGELLSVDVYRQQVRAEMAS